MQARQETRTNQDRSTATRAALLAAARKLFVEQGFSETGTPAIVAAAKVTRGALYHHFADKADLFRAVIEQEAEAVSAQIAQKTAAPSSPLAALTAGARAYLSAMAVPGRARLLLIEGPAVLPREEAARIESLAGGQELYAGLAYAQEQNLLGEIQLPALTAVLSAAFDRAALAIAEGAEAGAYEVALQSLLRGLLTEK